MTKILIYNNVNFHYEIIESVIVKYFEILNIDPNIKVQIYLYIHFNKSFLEYIKKKYPEVIFGVINDFDYFINCTIYDNNITSLDFSSNSNKKYISHEITTRLLTNPNVYYLTPLSKKNIFISNILPFSENKYLSDIPIYIIQGTLNQNRRDLSLLIKILNKSYIYKFMIKMVGRGHLPSCLNNYKDKIVLRNNLDFINYHKEFLNAYCILPLITKKTKPQYYTNKLTSTINYITGYKLKCIIDKDLQDIYNLNNATIFNDENDITDAFEKTLLEFYE